MPNIKSAIKRVKTTEARTKANASIKTAYKTAVKNFRAAVEAGQKDKAVELFKKAVEGGDGTAKTKLAWLKLSGFGGAVVDEDGAVALLEERVKEGDDDEAMWMLGVCNEYGLGTEQDTERAEDLYKQSSERRNEIGKFFATHRESGNMRMNRL